MTLIAVDVNASRIRLLQGPAPREGRPVALEGSEPDLPLAVNLEGRSALLGRAGLAICRRSPHLACINFLPSLGEQREWAGPRLKLDAAGALGLILDYAASRVGKHTAAASAVPDYLLREQRSLLRKLAEQARFKYYGSISISLASALAAHAEEAWQGLALVAEADEHALTWTPVIVAGGRATPGHAQSNVQLGLRAWKERLLDTISDACVRMSRRDPRDSADAEQTLFDQLDTLLAAAADNHPAELALRAPGWSQNLLYNPVDVANACRSLLERSLDAFHSAVDYSADKGPIRTVLLTTAAARLPGLVPALEQAVAELSEASIPVRVLDADGAARAVLEMAARWQRSALPSGHLDAAPLLEAVSPAGGHARLHYRGHDHPFRSTQFVMGRDPACDLAFDSAEFPSISARHCKIVHERGGFVLYDTSRHGTLVNDRPVVQSKALEPGDWIRLGPGGPLLRFLGHVLDQRQLMPTA